ncbi:MULTISPECIES: hypothetical protein [Brevibacillus]|jgi:hypothetical protein|uniref:Uncharacterized protein n=1 Tax=Brevibacillus thermoruber TaxID=33942 RepID=A0A9X3TNP7_9BACL|nr:MULTISPECIES: hypothetical protein [Brevibacillus]MDA5107745.1 hypothetical protein [Brevibacillus thermoruber]TRY25560.1 hypothetical protein FOI68_12165 [Brevibacillus sp. LEMMJ03]
MLAQEMGVIFTRHAEQMTAKRWTEFIQQLENKGLYVVIETDTNGRVMSPFGGLVPMPCKDETLHILTEEELQQRGLPRGHHIITKPKAKAVTT